MESRTLLNIQAIVNFLDRTQPEKLKQLRIRYPDYQAALSPGKILGEKETSRDLLMELAAATFAAAKNHGRVVSDLLRRKLRTSARLKMSGSIVSSLSSAGIVAAVFQGHTSNALIAGIVAFISALMTMIAQYIDDFAAGGGSTRELLQKVDSAMLEVFEAEGEFRLMAATNATAKLEDLVRKLNVSLALLRQVELRFG